jgi:hypothetical protein
MATVQMPDTFGQVPSAGPVSPYQTAAGATPDAFGGAVGGALQGLGRGLEQSGDMLARHALQFQAQQNEAAANEALTNYDIASANVYNEFKNLQGSIPQEKMPEYMQKLESVRSEMRGQLTNSDVQRQFDQGSRRQFGYTIKEMASHAAVENKRFQIATVNGRIAAGAQSIATLNASDDRMFDQKYAELRRVAEESVDVKGFEGPAREAMLIQKLSPVWERRLTALADTDPLRARKLFDANMDKIAPETIAPLKNRIDQEIIRDQSRIIGDRATAGGGSFDRLVTKESGGNPRAQNDLGYTGIYQFGAPRLSTLGLYTPGANESVGGNSWGGAKWSGKLNIPDFPEVKTIEDFKNSPAAQKKAFDLHVAKMDEEIEEKGLDKYIGKNVNGVNITRTGLYYMMHLGGAAGAERALTGRGDAADANGTTVMQYAKMGEGAVGGLTVDSGAAKLDDLVNAGKAMVAGAPIPEETRQRTEDAVVARIKTNYNYVKTVSREAAQANWNQASLLTLGGMTGPKNIEEFDALDPNAKTLRMSLSGPQQKALQSAFNQNAKADHPYTLETEQRFFELRGQALSSDAKTRQEFAEADVMNEEIPRARRAALAKMQQEMKKDEEGKTHLRAALGVVSSTLGAAGITPSGNKKRYDEFVGRFDDQLRLFLQDSKGKSPTEEETRKIAAGLLNKVVTSPGYLWDTKERLFEAPVPEAEAAKYKAKFPNATPEEIRKAYQRFKLTQ